MKKAKSGQGVVEYVLFSALVVGVVFGVLAPIFQSRIQGIQNRILDTGRSVISQTEMGIPECWFFCDSGSGFSIEGGVSSSGAGGGQGAGGAEGAGQGAGGDETGSGSGDGASGGDVAGGSGRGGRGSRSGGGGAGDGADQDGEDDSSAGGPRRKGTASSRGGSYSGDGSGTTGTIDGEQARGNRDDQGVDTETDTPESGEGGLVKKSKRAQEEERSGSRGCQNVDWLTLVKLLVIVMILLIIGAIALSNRGKNKGQ